MVTAAASPLPLTSATIMERTKTMVPYDNLFDFARTYVPSGSTCKPNRIHDVIAQFAYRQSVNLRVLHQHLIARDFDVVEAEEAVINHVVTELGTNVAHGHT